jgi:hypothetical protein
MNRKDIALTVTGIVATMALAYLFYRQQQQSAAAAAATQVSTAQDVTDPNYYTTQGDLYDASLAYQASQIASLSTPTVSSTSSTSTLAPSVDTSASTAATGNPPDSDTENLLSQILAGYYSTQNASSASQDFSSLEIPTLNAPPSITTTGIPTTATDALNDAQNAIGTNSDTGGGIPATGPGAPIAVGEWTPSDTTAVPPPSQQAPAVSSTGGGPAVHYNHIAAPQAA